MKRIFDPEFRYVPSFDTDVRKTFERIRSERSQPAAEDEGRRARAPQKAPPIYLLKRA